MRYEVLLSLHSLTRIFGPTLTNNQIHSHWLKFAYWTTQASTPNTTLLKSNTILSHNSTIAKHNLILYSLFFTPTIIHNHILYPTQVSSNPTSKQLNQDTIPNTQTNTALPTRACQNHYTDTSYSPSFLSSPSVHLHLQESVDAALTLLSSDSV